MEHEMRTDAELLNAIADEAPLVTDRLTGRPVCVSRKVIALWTGLSIQTISDYGTGKLNLPVDFWKRFLAHYLEPRVVALIMPPNCAYEVYPTIIPTPLGAPAFFQQMLAVEKAHHAMMIRIVDILGDGRVDELDGSSIKQYDDDYHEHRQRDDLLHRTVMATYQQAVAQKEAVR